MNRTQLLRFLYPLFFVIFLVACSNNRFQADVAAQPEATELAGEEEDEDGIREAQEMEFEMTRDPKLGYIPASRLVRAFDEITKARKAGRYFPGRTNALSWVERGPNSNSIGPSNGNTRGLGSLAVVSGRIRAIHVDLNDPTNRTVWVGSVSGGLWKTNDVTASPATWTLVNDFLGNLAIASICQSPVNKNILYFATGERNNNADAVRGGGIWKSTDNGNTWNLLPNTTTFWNVSKIVCDAAGNVYVGTNGNSQGLQRSTDGGASWTNITPANPANSTRITDIKVSNTGRLHVTMSGTSAAGSYYTDNPVSVTTLTWSSPLTPIPGLSLNCEIAVAGNTLYALPEASGGLTPVIYKSIDGGVTWAACASSPPGGTAEPTINAGQGWYDLALGCDPANPNIVVAGGLNFYRSTDGGNSWAQITRWVGTTFNYVHADHHGVFWNGSQVLLSTDGGIFYSNDNGFSYSDRNIGIRTLQFYSCAIHPTSTNYLLGGTQDNGSHSLNNPGIGASIEVHGGDGGFTHIDEDEPQFQYSATTRSSYRRSVNNGVNWSSITFSTTIGQFINPTEYDDINNRMYCSGSAGTYVRWDNPQTGSTFSTISLPAGFTGNTIRSFKVSPYTSNRVFMGTGGGGVLRVDNAHLSSPAYAHINSGAGMPNGIISSVNTGSSDNALIATYSNYGVQHVWVSVNGGTNWANIDGNLPDIPVRWAMFHPDDNDKAIIATEMGIFETDDINGAATVWVQNSTFPTVKTNMLQYRIADRTILAATHGRGFFTTTVPTANPRIRFATSYNYSPVFTESTTATDGCRSYRDVTLNMIIDAAPAGAADVTLSIGGGTALEGVDYDITTNGDFNTPSKTLQFAGGSTASKTVNVRIYNDAAVEGAESFVINLNVSGATNAIAAPGAQSFTVHIGDNDVAPLPSAPTNFTIGNASYTNGYIQPLRGQFAKSRSQYLYTASELTAAGVVAGVINSLSINISAKQTTQPFSNFNVSLKNVSRTDMSADLETGTVLFHSNSSYTSTAGVNTFTSNQNSFSWDGVSNLLVEFCFDNVAAGTTSDFVASSTTSFVSGAWARDNTAIPGCSMDGTNSTVFRGVNNGTTVDYPRPDITLGISVATNIETVLNRNRTNFVGGTGTTYFFSQGFNNLMSSTANASGSLGCVSFNIQEAGTVWQNYYGGQRSQKVFDVALTGNTSATYTIGLYVTAAELGGKTPGTLSIGQTSAANLSGANSGNTTVFATNVTAFGSDYLFTATVAGGGRFFLTDGIVSNVIDVTRTGETFVKLMQNPVRGSVFINISNEQRKNINASLFSNNGQLIKIWNLGKASGPAELNLAGTNLASGTYILRVFADNKAQSLKLMKN
ncbi:MAG TPA: T9SS type A sorting domain-containing protein [Lacibacter sp.]|nr:T9SS type A sorting domain-containing protein [Lacibacter sp.]